MVAITDNRITNIAPTPEELFHSAAKNFTERAMNVIQTKEFFTVVLSGGNTAKFFFDALTESQYCREKTPWNQIKFFFADERYVPSNHAENNYHLAYEHLFAKIPISPKNIYPIPTHFSNPKEAAKNYESTLINFFHPQKNAWPTFDLIYLGLGENAHTASLMPFSKVVTSPTNSWVASLWVPELNMYRITLTPSAINHAENIIFLVTGANKASAVFEIFTRPYEPEKYPAQLIHSLSGKTIWYLDQGAAGKL